MNDFNQTTTGVNPQEMGIEILSMNDFNQTTTCASVSYKFL